jgi:hypothetical protein
VAEALEATRGDGRDERDGRDRRDGIVDELKTRNKKLETRN